MKWTILVSNGELCGVCKKLVNAITSVVSLTDAVCWPARLQLTVRTAGSGRVCNVAAQASNASGDMFAVMYRRLTALDRAGKFCLIQRMISSKTAPLGPCTWRLYYRFLYLVWVVTAFIFMLYSCGRQLETYPVKQTHTHAHFNLGTARKSTAKQTGVTNSCDRCLQASDRLLAGLAAHILEQQRQTW